MMVSEIAAKFEGARQTGPNQWEGICPVHDDNKPSVSIGELDLIPGAVGIHCLAGCTNESILAELGLNYSDLFPDSSSRPKSGPQVVAKYDYADEQGIVLYQVRRFEPGFVAGDKKTFRQFSPDGRGGWVPGTKGVRLVLYHLQELLASTGTVFIVEGEKDVETLRRNGFTATCNVGGVGMGWRPAYKESLRGRHVVIIPDNDEPGRKHAAAIEQQLRGIAASVFMLNKLPEVANA